MITAEELRLIIRYDPETGSFLWLVSAGRSGSGTKAGCISRGYIAIRIRNKIYLAHRLAWLYMHGEWPKGQIDHINGVKNDNRICNLRLATPSQNGANTKRMARNTSGVKGVYWHRIGSKWNARICVEGRQIHLGLFTRKDDAAEAYRQAAIMYFGEFANTGPDQA